MDAHNGPDDAKLHVAGVTYPYFDIRDSLLTPGWLDSVKATGGYAGVGFYVAASWENWTPAEMATYTDKELKSIGWSGNAPICFDVEVDGLASYCLELMQVWRSLRPKRITDLTIEGHKGGVFGPGQLLRLAGLVRYVVPQCYNGDMTEVWDTYAMSADLYDAGLPFHSIRPFYDAAHLPEWWSGYAFTQGRLP